MHAYLLEGRGSFLVRDGFRGSNCLASCSTGGGTSKELDSRSCIGSSATAAACDDAALRSSFLQLLHIELILSRRLGCKNCRDDCMLAWWETVEFKV